MTIDTAKIDLLLAEQGMSKKELAGKCGLSRQRVCAIICRGSCEPRTAGKLAAGLGVPVKDIVEKEA